MNKGKFRAGMEEAYNFLKKLSLVRQKNVEKMKTCECSKYSTEWRKLSKKNDYIKLYQYAIAYNEFDILLQDFSFFQFSYDSQTNVIRMAYYPNPDLIGAFEEYLTLEGRVGYLSNTFEVERLREEYENFIESQDEWKQVTPFRYDYSEKEYNGLIHSASHFHFGQNENIRVALDKILTPYSFAVLVVNYYYYSLWKNKINGDAKFVEGITGMKQKCEKVSDTYISDDERRYFYVC